MNGARRIAMIAAYPQWGGGVRVDHLASLLRMRPADPRLWQAIWQARKMGLIDLYRGWVITDRGALDQRRGRS